ncbi:MAG: tyrosine-type recombinase/integrase [Dehalococcoidia bacterium]
MASPSTCCRRAPRSRAFLYERGAAEAAEATPESAGPAVLDSLLSFSPENPSTPAGLRDRAMLGVLYGGRLRISELVSLDMGKVDLGEGEGDHHGKGSKERVALFSEPAMRALERYLESGRRCSCGRVRARWASNHPGAVPQQVRPAADCPLRAIVHQAARRRRRYRRRHHPHLLRHSFATPPP